MILKELTEEQIDFSIDMIFIHLGCYFEDEECLLNNLSHDTKIGDIFDEIITQKGLSIRELIKDVAKGNAISIKLPNTPSSLEIGECIQQLENIKTMTEIDISPILNFFAPLSIREICAFQVPGVDFQHILLHERTF